MSHMVGADDLLDMLEDEGSGDQGGDAGAEGQRHVEQLQCGVALRPVHVEERVTACNTYFTSMHK